MKQFSDNFPLNARINIDYKTNKVVFGYPINPKGKMQWIFKFIYPTFVILWVFILIGFSTLFFAGVIISFILTQGIQIQPISEPIDFPLFIKNFLIIFLNASLFFLPPLFPAIYVGYNYSKFKTVFPKWNAILIGFFKNKKRTIVKKLDKPLFELPAFKNVVLEYVATKDYALFLDRIEVVEHDFKIIKKKKGKEILIPQDDLWKAIFHFSKVPKKGELKITYI